MVEQLGLAIILSSLVSSSALISGTISFLVGSMRQADELSMTVIPASANRGAHSSEVSPPAEKIATSGVRLMASLMPMTFISFSWKINVFPMDFSDATARSSVTGKFLSCNTLSITVPTRPVAPTMATFMVIFFYFHCTTGNCIMEYWSIGFIDFVCKYYA